MILDEYFIYFSIGYNIVTYILLSCIFENKERQLSFDMKQHKKKLIFNH